ncbi:MAG TPA: acyl-CoA dehydrogenase [Streptosporangiaceae bacterium]|nr:acyl-CoA dehydrogenase [Streptosporangiaceae bacterium]
MDLALTDEQRSVQELFSEFFSKESTPERVRAAEALGFDQPLWDALTGIDAVTMGLPEDVGGAGASALDLVLVAEQFGQRIAAVPLVEAMVAASVLARSEAGRGLLDLVTDGTVIPTIALRPVVARVVRLAPAGAVADVIVALDGDDLVAVRRPGQRPYTQPPRNLASAPIADWDLAAAGSQRSVLASGEQARQAYSDAVSLWRVLTGAALCGLRRGALDIGVSYVKVREAFGAPIGHFQAIQHRLADLYAAGDALQLLVYEAGWAWDADPVHAQVLSCMSFLAAAEIAFRTCREALQFHGGYGVTVEYDIQMYYRRAKAWPLAAGPVRDSYQHLAGLLFDEPGRLSPGQE